MDISTTLKERGERYGVFADHARIAQCIQNAMRAQLGWSRLADDQRQALTVIADKIARMLNGDPNYIDNWHDIIGYAKLVEARLEGEQAKSTEALLKIHTHSVVTTIAANDNKRRLLCDPCQQVDPGLIMCCAKPGETRCPGCPRA
jgi:hypothetical protein